jgi:type VI secretion system protein ImpL
VAPLIEQFLDSAFIGVQGAPEPLLRGVYFTSGTQEGNPIDRVLGTLARSFKLERTAGPAVAAGTGKSYFLTRLVRDVIFPESGLASSDEGLERRERRARLLAFASIAAASLALAALWAVSYASNRNFIASARDKAMNAKSELEKIGPSRTGNEAQLIRALNMLRDLPGGYSASGSGAGAYGFGLSQEEKLGSQALRAYRNALRDALAPRLAASGHDYSKWRLSDTERADLAGHVRAIEDEAIITNTRQKMAPAKAS